MSSFKQRNEEYAKEQVKSNALDRELIWRLLGYLFPYRYLLVVAVAFLIISKVIEASVPIFIGRVSQQILDAYHLAENQKETLLSSILQACTIIIFFLILSYILDSINVILKSWIGQNGLYKFRMQVYEHILRMPLSYFDQHTVGRLMTRTIHDIDQINQMFAECVIPILGNILLFIGIFVGIAIIDWQIAIFVLCLLPFVWWLTHRFKNSQRRCYDRVRTVVAAMNTYVQEHLMGASTIRNFGLQKQAKERFEKINEDHCNAYLESIHHFAFFMAGIDLLQNASLIFVFALIVIFSPGGFEAGTYFTFSLYALMFFRPLGDLAERYNVLQSAMASAARIFHLLDTSSENAKDLGKSSLEGVESIAFEDVWFAYAEENWVLRGVSFSIKKGESYALVGMTGEGKSTIMSLLLRFYEIQKGAIKINGQDIHSYPLDELRKHFSIVLQDPVIFSGTIAENISLFDPAIPHQEIDKVVDYLGMRHCIDRFAKKLDHQLHEQGRGLSTGEMQLVSMARAVVHRRSVLILDEATANIDMATEHVIQTALKKILETTTAFVIAHRLSTIKDVSRIFVLKEGKIIEEGAHDELLAQKGAYEKLYRLQFESKQQS